MILAVLQARMGSSRLPGKVLMPILGEPMLLRQIERIRRCKLVDGLVVATSTSRTDDPLADICQARGIPVGRGSENDVLSRFIDVAKPYKPAAVVRLTGDCPLTDPEVIDAVIATFKNGAVDYASNVEPATFPDGLDTEVISWSAMLQADREAVLPSHREHVTLYIRSKPETFRTAAYTRTPDLSHLRWTVDEPADLEFVRRIYEALYPAKPDFVTADVLHLLEANRHLADVNRGFERNEGLRKSLEGDAVFLAARKNSSGSNP
ncbi:MAG: NTP transferase domain-containing protein [Rhodospirillaceae bacterium]